MKYKRIPTNKPFYSLKARFCLFLVVITAGFLTLVFCEKEFFLIKKQFFWSASFLSWILLLSLGFGLNRFFKVYLPKQKIHNQPSWVYYFYWGVLWLCIPMIFLCLFKAKIIDITNLTFRDIFILLDMYIISLLLGVFIYQKTKPREFLYNIRFAPDSVGLNQDEFQFENSARNIAKGIFSLDNYVNVVSLHGEPGSGKSSYVRMIIESIDERKILYSYISLTETNEGKDFSKLFSERWYETLSTRYPKIHISEYFSLLHSIFRESRNGIFFGLMNFLAKFNCGVIQTKAKASDKYIIEKKEFVTSGVAKLFGNVTSFTEDFWIIVIDELERSPIAETYRIIEMIERFKLEGRNGLPIKIVFFLCLGDDIKGLIKLDEKEEIRYLVDNFMFKSPKSITQRLFLPPIVKSLKYDFISNLILQFKKKNSIAGMPEKRDDFTWGYFNPIKEQLNDIDSIKFTADILVKESPRLIKRCLSEVQLFYKSFRDTGGIEVKDAIRFSDILLISYIKLKHSNLITFFAKTCERLYSESQNELDPEYLSERISRNKDANEKVEVKLLKWISSITNMPYEELEKLPIVNLVAAISHSYVDRVNDIYSVESGITYDGTLSDPPRLIDYLMCVNEFAENKRKKFIDLYKKHQAKDIDLTKLENKDLIEYSRVLRDIKKTQPQQNLEVATELCNRIIKNKIELMSSTAQSDTMRQDAVYQFSFQLLEVLEHQRTNKLRDETKSAANLFKILLNSQDVDTGSKFIVINSFVNEDRGGGSDINFRLQRVFETMLKIDRKGIIDAIQNTFKEVDLRYLSGDEIIYDKEENFFYVLYQAWSGKVDNKDELIKIHEAAVRGLENNIEAIKLYWSRFPAPPNAQDYDDAVEDAHFFGEETKEFNVTLKKLLEISNKQPADVFNAEEKRKIGLWQKIVNTKEDAKKYYQRCAIKDKNDTLAAFLIRKGYLTSWPPTDSRKQP